MSDADERIGIPEDIIRQVDRTALWALVCVAEALMMSGITDPYELFKYVHPSEIGSALGSGMGGMQRRVDALELCRYHALTTAQLVRHVPRATCRARRPE